MKRKRIIIYLGIITLAIIFIIATRGVFMHKRLAYSDLDTVCFERDILPVFNKNCGVMGCHDRSSASAAFVFTDYNSIIKSITPFNPDKSLVYKALIGKGASPMPPGNLLKENERMLIRVWIGQGAKNTTCSVPTQLPK